MNDSTTLIQRWFIVFKGAITQNVYTNTNDVILINKHDENLFSGLEKGEVKKYQRYDSKNHLAEAWDRVQLVES